MTNGDQHPGRGRHSSTALESTPTPANASCNSMTHICATLELDTVSVPLLEKDGCG